MDKRSSKRKKAEHDFSVVAHRIVEQATSDNDSIPGVAVNAVSLVSSTPTADKNPHAVALGHLGGKKGGPARANKLSPEEKARIARRGAEARWGKKR